MVVSVIAGAREHPRQPSWSRGVAFGESEHKPARLSRVLPLASVGVKLAVWAAILLTKE